MVGTGIKRLDEILGGGIRRGIITDIFGASGSGKTQMTMQIMANALSDGIRIFYQDTTGSFRPERLVELLAAKGLTAGLLDNITVSRATNTREQIDGLQALGSGDFELAVIDSVTDLFSFEYSREEQLLEKTTQFAKYIKSLSVIAADKKIAVVVVNMIRKMNQTERENMDSVISVFTHIKIRLEKKQAGYEGWVILSSKITPFSYRIAKEGLTDAG